MLNLIFPKLSFKFLTRFYRVFIEGHVGLLQLLKWQCRTSFFTLVEPSIWNCFTRRHYLINMWLYRDAADQSRLNRHCVALIDKYLKNRTEPTRQKHSWVNLEAIVEMKKNIFNCCPHLAGLAHFDQTRKCVAAMTRGRWWTEWRNNWPRYIEAHNPN